MTLVAILFDPEWTGLASKQSLHLGLGRWKFSRWGSVLQPENAGSLRLDPKDQIRQRRCVDIHDYGDYDAHQAGRWTKLCGLEVMSVPVARVNKHAGTTGPRVG